MSQACNSKSKNAQSMDAQLGIDFESSDDNIPVLYDSNYVLEELVNGIPASILADTGAAVTMLSKDIWDRARASDEQLKESGKKLVGMQRSPLERHSIAQLNIKLQGEIFTTEAIVADSLTTDIILGLDFVRNHQCTIKMRKSWDVLRFNRREVEVPLHILNIRDETRLTPFIRGHHHS